MPTWPRGPPISGVVYMPRRSHQWSHARLVLRLELFHAPTCHVVLRSASSSPWSSDQLGLFTCPDVATWSSDQLELFTCPTWPRGLRSAGVVYMPDVATWSSISWSCLHAPTCHVSSDQLELFTCPRRAMVLRSAGVVYMPDVATWSSSAGVVLHPDVATWSSDQLGLFTCRIPPSAGLFTCPTWPRGPPISWGCLHDPKYHVVLSWILNQLCYMPRRGHWSSNQLGWSCLPTWPRGPPISWGCYMFGPRISLDVVLTCPRSAGMPRRGGSHAVVPAGVVYMPRRGHVVISWGCLHDPNSHVVLQSAGVVYMPRRGKVVLVSAGEEKDKEGVNGGKGNKTEEIGREQPAPHASTASGEEREGDTVHCLSSLPDPPPCVTGDLAS
ncbi:hypothetical protein C7M84_009221 [Penaeus vannamei]|uniref:Uncharacterized protein n=1 Tax=Penaeus vannamei TaxID=6689 RepID=A0A423T7H0_PENVA|nr:hypothetical protein C7M84_009221 [Penaeus vannamei]